MPLRLFGGRGSDSDKVRACPACEQEVAATATFCPSCYMVFRPEGTADLREHLQGGRIPSDVYLLRMLAGDPDTGPVVRVSGKAPESPADTSSASASPRRDFRDPSPPATPVAPSAPSPAAPVSLPDACAVEVPAAPPSPVAASPPAAATPTAPVAVPDAEGTIPARGRDRGAGDPLLGFDVPLPPPTRSIEETPALFAWMLEKDPIIPNNLERLQRIHTQVFQDKPAGRLEYEEHILLQIADDLALHPTREAMDLHLRHLTAGYRRAAEAYHVAAHREEQKAVVALWQMASMASRIRVEAWVYESRHGASPAVAGRGDSQTGKAPSE